MDKKLPWLFLALFVAQQLLHAPVAVCAQNGGAVQPALQAGADALPAKDAAGDSKAQKSHTRSKPSIKTKKTGAKNREKSSSGIHAPAWAFDGGGQSREAWREGTSSGELKKRAVGEEAAKDKAVNTESGINSALKTANAQTERKNGLAVSVGQDESAWRKKSQLEPETADENIPMQSRHVVRAYADVDAGDNLNVRVGPELILKDEQRERAGANKQPESALGMGMQFKLGF